MPSRRITAGLPPESTRSTGADRAEPRPVRDTPTTAALHHGRTILSFAALLLRRPLLLGPLLLAAWRFRARGWWRRAPFLPLPPRAYLEWRLDTAFGASGELPGPRQLERYLRWTRRAARGGPRQR